jgi:hypothetical protein
MTDIFLFFRSVRRAFMLACTIVIFATQFALAQVSGDSLVERSLMMVDYPPFTAPPAPMLPRLGIFMRDITPDSVRALTKGRDSVKGCPIWHLAPHWSADEAGLMLGDIVIRVDGRSLADSVYGPDDILNTRVREKKPGEIMQFQIIRGGAMREIPVKLLTGKRSVIAFNEPAGLGPIRNSWLQKTIDEHGLRGWTDTIARQIANNADVDFCDKPFASRPSPFRLNAITYLDHYPLRVGALSRLIDRSVWDSLNARRGVAGALQAAAVQLGCLPAASADAPIPATTAELEKYFSDVQHALDRAYAPVRDHLDSLSHGLGELLNTDTNWEDSVGAVTEPIRQLQLRNAAENMLTGLLGDADKVDLKEVVRAARMLAALADSSWVAEFAKQWATAKPIAGKVTGVTGDILKVWTTPQGRCIIGGKGMNTYSGDFAFIFDVGGDDVYDLPPCKPGSFRFIADASGNDIYRGARSAGSGVGCVDVLVDLSGNDIYQGASWSQGAGCLGVGIVADYGGDDIYTAHWCAQGAAFLGIGLVYDHAGSDHYTADVYSQGFGYAKGFGMLLDRSGNDAYRAGWKYPDDRWPNRAHVSMSQGFGFGMRPWSTGVGTDGGIGLLSDMQGDDVYDADYFSQGGSYWYGLGILHDRQGADRYSAGQYSQGSGIHLSFGALLDDAGDDSYDAYAWLEQGNAHDWSAGCLEDYGGNDTYRSSGASQGCGFFVSFAYLLDAQGDDRYYIKQSDTTNSQGGGNFILPRHSGSFGALIDLGHGDDWYLDPRIKQGEAVIKSQKGVAYDDGAPEKK